ncbi:FitA-like ribbon-helix-helix domain-containing protein [Robbsia andropogonis]|uniref:FitA-like ribbon-helix-helix domain-containing protein n=1 Tax=Robbsia andropogonis TaxID=28092 RepID=UPI00209CFECB|nr:DNA-binding protein [Robbsia andropogonis]MCP1121411.1 DNA-binding protein [Robbsia andropogonis]MCP1131202.1 DNA-binding protein [Robbsia andropogonis]
MKSLVVRNLDDAIVDALRARAIANGRSAEAEHREILAEVLCRPQRRSFADILASMPNVGRDEDFERVSVHQAAPNVFS